MPMSESQKAGVWETTLANERGLFFGSGDVVGGDIEEAVVEGCAVEKATGDKIEGCRVVNQIVETDQQSNSRSGRGNNMYNIDVCKTAEQYTKQDECSNDKTNINRGYSGNNRGGDTRVQREVREYKGYASLDSVARREAHKLTDDREAENDIRRVVTRRVGQAGRARMQAIGSWFGDARSRQALDRVRGKYGSLRKFLQTERGFLVYMDQRGEWCIRVRDDAGRGGMEHQGMTRKQLLKSRTHIMLRQWRSTMMAGVCQAKSSRHGDGSRWSSCSLWMGRAVSKTLEERFRQNDGMLEWWLQVHPWTKSLVDATPIAGAPRASKRHQLSRAFQSALQMFMEDRNSSIRERSRLSLYYHRQKRLPWGVQRPTVGGGYELGQVGLERWCG